ncbi:MAG TPA: glycoside hydrolase family 3 C-terminal domain-containing protein, partial [Steroidobacteraceae bacterium]|nr:glycoside hydrolase family 3 C-terminal domain-containing protein [Steroidobacteraceae bacterium]
MNTSSSAEERTQLVMKEMTQKEKLQLVFGYYSSDAPWKKFTKPEGGLPQSAGYIAGIPRLNIPAQYQTDAGIGVASQPGDNPTPATSLPNNLAVTASWDPDIAFAGGKMIGAEARSHGFNIMLAGGVNLTREPRNGRNFEYGGEDPILAATMVGAQLRGIQSNNVVATIKHYALNDQETNRGTYNAIIDERAARMSDLLAFELAIKQAEPGSVMCAYNRVNGSHSCENHWLLTDVLKNDWQYKGYVMSDWGAVHSTIPAANAGLDQQSGFPFDHSAYFADALKDAVVTGYVPQSRLDDMARRILWAMFKYGLFDHPTKKGEIDFAAHAVVTRTAAEQSMVLLKNDRDLLPLKKDLKSISIIGSHADIGVLSGGGSSQVYPPNGVAAIEKHKKHGTKVHHASSPLKALSALTSAKFLYAEGNDIATATLLAKQSEVVIVFASQWNAEGFDHNLKLDNDQDALINAVAATNSNVIVVLQTGSAVEMPWLNNVGAVLQAWFPGTSGGEAIARVLTGAVNPGGHLPITFPASIEQLPRKTIDGDPDNYEARPDVNYNIEGAAVGYKWFDRNKLKPLFPFGYGLSYTTFSESLSNVSNKDDVASAQIVVSNTGKVDGEALVQIYVSPLDAKVASQWEAPQRLGGFKKVAVRSGGKADVSVDIEPHAFAIFDMKRKR